MSTTNGTMNKPKLELLLDKPIKLTLLKDKPYVGQNNYGEFYLFNVKDEQGIEYSYFADASIYNMILEHKLKAGSSFVLQRVAVMNGKKMSSKVEFSIIGEPEPVQQTPSSVGSDNLKELLLQCVRDAADVVKAAGIQFNNDELQKLATTLFIQRSRSL
ncbi:MAG: hypothetical protein ACYC09_10965 [Bacteroidota bacterium]